MIYSYEKPREPETVEVVAEVLYANEAVLNSEFVIIGFRPPKRGELYQLLARLRGDIDYLGKGLVDIGTSYVELALYDFNVSDPRYIVRYNCPAQFVYSDFRFPRLGEMYYINGCLQRATSAIVCSYPIYTALSYPPSNL